MQLWLADICIISAAIDGKNTQGYLMIKISREEVLHIASLSRIDLSEEEIPELIKNLEEALTYAARVQEIAAGLEETSSKNVNVLREDVVRSTDPAPILANAPKREENYIVVPVVLE
jgi:aspartyl-tRNA(Asn)/glutamyl-tRNA(Gln) amidotransferase subunit C